MLVTVSGQVSDVRSGTATASVAAEFGIGWPVVHRHYAAHADGLLAEPDPPAVPGIDETRRGRPKSVKDCVSGKWRRTELSGTNFTDLAGDGRLLGRPPGRPGRR